MAFNTKQHDKVLQRTLDEIDSGVFDNAKALENEIAELVALGLPAETVRPQIITAFNRYSETVRSVAQPLTDISQDYLDQSVLPTELADQSTANTLLITSQDTLSTTVNTMSEDVVSTVVLATVAGLTVNSIVNQVRGRISGIQMDTNNPSIRKLQRKLRKMQLTPGVDAKEIAATVAAIRAALPGDVNTSASLITRLRTAADSIVGSFDGAFAKARATRLGISRFRYEGGLIETSRPFCRDMLGRELNIDEIQSKWSGSSWKGKEPGDPFVVRGGYNCRHYWVPIESEED